MASELRTRQACKSKVQGHLIDQRIFRVPLKTAGDPQFSRRPLGNKRAGETEWCLREKKSVHEIALDRGPRGEARKVERTL